MTQYTILNVNLTNLQLDNLKCGIKNGTEVTSLVILMMKIIFLINRY